MPEAADRADVEQQRARKLNSRRAGDRLAQVGRGVGQAATAAGRAEQATGAAMQAAGEAAVTAGRGAQAAGRTTAKLGQGMVQAGKGLSETGYGAIAGVPLAAVGAVVGAGGTAAQVAGRATEASGRASLRAGRRLSIQGKELAQGGRQLKQARGRGSATAKEDGKSGGVTGKLSAQVRRLSAQLLRGSWLNIMFIVPGVYIVFHFWGRYILRSPIFCRFGEEWIGDVRHVAKLATASTGGPPVAPLINRGQGLLEKTEFAALPVVVLVIGTFAALIMAVSFVADYLAEHPISTIVCGAKSLTSLIEGAGEYGSEVIACILDKG